MQQQPFQTPPQNPETEPASTPQFGSAPSPTPKKSGTGLKVVIGFLSVLLLASVGYGVYGLMKTNELHSQVTTKDSEIAALKAQEVGTESDTPIAAQSAKAAILSEKLPGGKTLKYELTAANATVIWWKATDTAVSVSDKRVIAFLKEQSENAVVKANCAGGNFGLTELSLGLFDTAKKTYLSNQYADCLAMLASDTTNKDATSRTAAKTLRDDVVANLKKFISESTIE